MFRGLLLFLVQLLVMPWLALLGMLLTLIAPRTEGVDRAARVWAWCCLHASGARVRIEGRERLENAGPAVVVANHTSSQDIYLFCRFLPIPFRMVAKESLFRIPFLGWAIRAAGFVPLERSGSRKDLSRLNRINWGTSRRAVIGFFPEGTRSLDGRLHPFKKGAFLTAIRDQVPILPIALVGVSKLQKAGSLRVFATPVVMKVLDPIPTTGLSPHDRDRLADLAYAQIEAALPPEQLPPAEPVGNQGSL